MHLHYLQVFLLKTEGLVGIDKVALKKEVLDVVTDQGEIALIDIILGEVIYSESLLRSDPDL